MNTIKEAAAALGRKGGMSKSERKIAAILRNLQKANAAVNAEQRKERARKASAARWSKGKR